MRRRVGGVLLLLPLLTVEAATYKWIDNDGRVNYGDRPPEGVIPRQMDLPAGPSRDSAEAALPFLLRNVAARHPVTVYSTNPCGACDLARSHLIRRGIPYSERTVRTAQDLEAFAKLGFTGMALPVILVGQERLNGYDAGRLDRSLDVVGYPGTSMLPSTWRPPVASPLAPSADPESPAASGTTDGNPRETPGSLPFTTLRPEPAPRPGSSTGIRF